MPSQDGCLKWPSWDRLRFDHRERTINVQRQTRQTTIVRFDHDWRPVRLGQVNQLHAAHFASRREGQQRVLTAWAQAAKTYKLHDKN